MSSGTLPRNSGLLHRRRHRVELLAVLQARHEQHVDAHGLVGLQPRDGVFDAGDADRAGAADDDEARVLTPGQRRAHLADALLDRKELPLVAAERGRQQRVLDGQRRDARGLQLLDRALDAHRIAVAVVGVDAERQRAGAVDAVGLLREFGQRQHADVGRGDHAERTDRAREHHRLEAHVGGDPRRNAVVDGRRINTSFTIDDGAQPLAPLGPVHCHCPSRKPRNLCRSSTSGPGFQWACAASLAGSENLRAVRKEPANRHAPLSFALRAFSRLLTHVRLASPTPNSLRTVRKWTSTSIRCSW